MIRVCFLIFYITFCLISAVSRAASVGCPYNFASKSTQDLQSLETGVVQVVDSSLNMPVGTAYFISDKLLITAEHVIAGHRSDALNGQSPALNQGHRFAVRVLEADERQEYDVALLRVDDPAFRGPVTTIDISFWVPGATANLWVIGYPAAEPSVAATNGPLNRVLQKGDRLGLRLDNVANHPLYEVKHQISQGYSVGPLLTTEGHVIGTVHKVRDGEMAYYEPLYLDTRLLLPLREVELSSALSNINDMLFKGGAST